MHISTQIMHEDLSSGAVAQREWSVALVSAYLDFADLVLEQAWRQLVESAHHARYGCPELVRQWIEYCADATKTTEAHGKCV